MQERVIHSPKYGGPQYDDDSKGRNYIGGAQRRAPSTRVNYEYALIESDEAKLDIKSTRVDVMVLEYSEKYYIKKLKEMDVIIRDQQARLDEFERIRFFESGGPDLPDDYYENDAYLDQ